MLELFISAFTTLFLVIDPPGCAPIYAGLTANASPRQGTVMAFRATVIATAILVVFALFGEQLLGALHIALDSFRIAGGVMLFLIALDMVFEKRTQRREERAEKIRSHPEVEDVSVFPMAMPMIAGPGSIASVMLAVGKSDGWQEGLIVLAAMASILLLTLGALLASGSIMRFVSQNVETVITRLLGVILAALAAQFVINGIHGSFG